MTMHPLSPRLLFLVPVATLLVSGCTPDTTRDRVEHDVTATFANQYVQSEQVQSQPLRPAQVRGTECHSGLNKTADAGPGAWHCTISWTDPAGGRHDDGYVVLVDSLGCYQAFSDEERDATVRSADGLAVPDPRVGFDGCYDVYDGRTGTSKA
jgi:hypothetical protein